MSDFATKYLAVDKDDDAPDGSDVRILLRLPGGSMAHFELGPGRVSRAVTHDRLEEIWFFLNGRGQMWRRQGNREEIVDVYPGVCVTIPHKTHFQFRSFGYEPLSAVGVTMPPWSSPDDATILDDGKWEPIL